MASYAEERLAKQRALSQEIRRRSAEMEREVAKFLLGRRVPMSGAGSMKGDCEIETEKIGRIFIECKYTARIDPKHGPSINIDFKWLDKMHKDAASMKARFAALVFKFHGSRLAQYVIISTDVLNKYGNIDHITNAPIFDAGKFGSLPLKKHDLEKAFIAHGRDICRLVCNRGEYVIMSLALFKEFIHATDTTE